MKLSEVLKMTGGVGHRLTVDAIDPEQGDVTVAFNVLTAVEARQLRAEFVDFEKMEADPNAADGAEDMVQFLTKWLIKACPKVTNEDEVHALLQFVGIEGQVKLLNRGLLACAGMRTRMNLEPDPKRDGQEADSDDESDEFPVAGT